MSIALSSFFPVEVSGRIAIVLTGRSPVDPTTLGGLTIAATSCSPLSWRYRLATRSAICRSCAVSLPVGRHADQARLGLRIGAHRKDEERPDGDGGDERQACIDEHEPRPVGGAARPVAPGRIRLRLGHRLGRFGVDEAAGLTHGRLGAGFSLMPTPPAGPAARGLWAASDRGRELERRPDRLVREIDLRNRDLGPIRAVAEARRP